MSSAIGGNFDLLPSREILLRQQEILKGPCMIDDDGNLVKISLEERVNEHAKKLDHCNEDLLAIHQAWIEKCQQIQSKNQGIDRLSPGSNIDIPQKVSKLLKQSPKYRKIIANMSKKHLTLDSKIAKESGNNSEQTYKELREFELNFNVHAILKDHTDATQTSPERIKAKNVTIAPGNPTDQSVSEIANPWLQEGVGLGLPDISKNIPAPQLPLKARQITVKEKDDVIPQTMNPKKMAALAHSGADTRVSVEEAPNFTPLKPLQLDFINKLANKPLFDAAMISSERLKPEAVAEFNTHFQFCLHQLNALAQAIQRRGPALERDAENFDNIAAELAKLKHEIAANPQFSLAPSSDTSSALANRFDTALEAVKNVRKWSTSFDKYLSACEMLETSMEGLNAQLNPDGGLKDLSTEQLPKAMQALCGAALFGNTKEVDPKLREEMISRLGQELDFQGTQWSEDWLAGFQKSIATEEKTLRQELQKLIKKPLRTPAEARSMTEILCQIELLQKSLNASKAHFIKGAAIIAERLINLKDSSIWGYPPGTKEHNGIMESLKEVEKRLRIASEGQRSIEEMMEEQGVSLKEISQKYVPQLEKLVIGTLFEAVDQSKKLVLEEGIPESEHHNRLSDLKLLYFMLKTIQPKSKEGFQLAVFINGQTMHKGISDPLDDHPETLRMFLAARRPPLKRSVLGKLYHAIFSPEEWSPATKENVSLLFTSLQLMQTATHLASLPKQAAQLKARADAMQKELLRKVPTEAQDKITKTTDRLGTILGDKFTLFQKEFNQPDFASRPPGEKFKNNLTNGNIPLENALIEIFKTHSSAPDSIGTIKDSFHLAQSMTFIEGRGSPFASLSFADWFTAFSTAQGDQEATSQEVPSNNAEAAESPSKPTEGTSAKTTESSGYLDSIKNMVSGLWSRFAGSQTHNVTQIPPFIQKQQEAARVEVNSSLEKTEELLVRVDKLIARSGNKLSVSQPHVDPLKQNIMQAQAALDRGRTQLDRHNDLANLTSSMQFFDDQCQLICELEKGVAEAEKVAPEAPETPKIKPDSVLASTKLERMAAEDIDARRVHAFLSNPKIGSVDSKLLVQLIGHASPTLEGAKLFGERLEGNEQLITMSYQLKIVDAILVSLKEHSSCGPEQAECCCTMLGLPKDMQLWKHPEKIEEVRRQLQTAIYISEPLFEASTKARESIKAQHKAPEAFRERLSAQVNRLTPGESFFFPGGWLASLSNDPKASQEGSGHGTAWEATMQANGKLTIRHYNTGGGINYHTMSTIGLNNQFLHFTEIVDVDPARFISSSFSTALWDLQGTSLPQNVQDWGAVDIYAGLLRSLGGKFSSKSYSQSEMRLPQFIGICAMDSIMAVVDKTLADDASTRFFRYLSTLYGTVSYFDGFKNELVSGRGSEERRRLLQEGIKSLAVRTDAVIEDGTISDEELAYVKELMNIMSKDLKKAETAAAARTKTEAPLVTFSAVPLPVQTMTVPSNYQSLEATIAKPGENAVRVHVPIDTSGFTFDRTNPPKLVTDLGPLLTAIHKGNHEHRNYFEVQKAIKDIILKIKLNDHDFWNALDSKSAQELLSTLTEINKEYLWSFLHNDERPGCERELSSDDFLAQWKILSLTDFIVHQFPDSLEIPIPSLFQNSFRSLLKERDWSVPAQLQLYGNVLPVHPSPAWRDVPDELRQYWGPQDEETNDLFGFDHYHAGHPGALKRRIAESEDYRWVQNNPDLQRNKDDFLSKRSSWYASDFRFDVELLKKWAEEHPDKVKELDPSLAGKSSEEQAMGLLHQIDKLPQYRDAFANSYIFDYFLTGSFKGPQRKGETQRNAQPLDFSKGITFEISRESEVHSLYDKDQKARVDRHISCTEMGYSLFGSKPTIDRNDPTRGSVSGIEYYNGHAMTVGRSPDYLVPGTNLRNTVKLDFDPTLGRIHAMNSAEVEYRLRYDPSDIVMEHPPAKSEEAPYLISVEHHRNLLSASSGLQIPNTIGLFESDTQLLFKPAYQINFRMLIMEGNLLENWLKKSPQSAGRIARLCQKVSKLATESGDLNAAIIIAGMSERVADVYRKEFARNPELFKKLPEPEFLDASKILNDVINLEDVSDEQRALAHRERAVVLGLKSQLTVEEGAQLLQSVVYTHLFRLPKGYRNDEEISREVDFLIRNRFEKQFIAFMNGPERDRILTSVLRIFLPNPIEGNWSSPDGFPHFKSPDGQISINILDGTIRPLGGTPIPFDHGLLENPKMNAVFGHRPPKMQVGVSHDTIEMRDQIGNAYRLSGFWNIRLYRNFDGNWLQFEEPTSTAQLIRNQALLSDTHLWYRTPAQKGEHGEIFFTDKQSGKVRYRGTLKSEDGRHLTLEKIERLDDSEKLTGQQLLSARSPALASFLRFEAEEYVMGWERNGQLEEVELPRFGLTFKVVEEDGKRKAICEQLSGYSIVEGDQQHIPELGDVGHYLRLQRIENDGYIKEVVVLPRHFIMGYSQGPLRSDTIVDKGVEIGKVAPQRFFEYAVKPGELVPMTSNEQEAIEANLYLAMVHLSERSTFVDQRETQSKYMTAKKYLDRVDQQMLRSREPLAGPANEVLTEISTMDSVTKDKHPDASAIQLKAHYLILRNQLDFDQPTSVTDLEPIYTQYLTHLTLVDKSLLLPKEEELAILKSIGNLSTVFSNRLKQLTDNVGAEGREAIAAVKSVKVSPIFLATPSRIDPKKFIDQLLNPPTSGPAKGVLLRNIDASTRFYDYYAVAKGDKSVAESVAILNQGMGLNLRDEISKEELLLEMKMALLLNSGTILAYKNDDWFVSTLLAIIINPEAFMPASEVPKILSTLEAARKNKKDLPELIRRQDGDLVNAEDIIDVYKIKLEHKQKMLSELLEKGADETDHNKKRLEKEVIEYQRLIKVWGDKILSIKTEMTSLQEQLETAEKLSIEQEELLLKGLIDPTNQLISQNGLELAPDLQQERPQSLILENEKAAAGSAAAREAFSIKEDFRDLSFAECIELRAAPHQTHHTLEKPVVPKEALDQFLKPRPPKPLAGVSAKPEKLFAVKPKDPSLAQVFNEADKAFVEYVNQEKGIPPEYDLIAPNMVTTLCDTLSKDITALHTNVKVREDALLALANKFPDDKGQSAERSIQMHKGSFKLLGLDEVIRAFYMRDYDFLHQRNPTLKKEEIKQLFSDLKDFLLEATHLNQQNVVLNEAQKLKTSITSGATDEVRQEQIRSFLDAANARRAYNYDDHPEFLVFEYFGKMLIWEVQVAKIEAMHKPDRLGALIELAMGMGKSHVIAPLLAWMNADGENLSISIMPDPLISAMAKEQQEKVGLAFNQKVRTMLIERKPITVARLERLYDNLCAIRDQRQVLMWAPSDAQSLLNQWIEINEVAFEKQQKGTLSEIDKTDLSAKHSSFLKIFKLLTDSGKITVDEIHQVFDILKSHSFTFGQAEEVHSDISTAMKHLFSAIVSDVRLQNIHWNFLPDSEGESFTEESYHSSIKGTLVDVIIDRGIAPDDPEVQKFFKDLSSGDKQLIREYLMDVPKEEGASSVNIRSGYQLLKDLPGDSGQRIRNQMAALKETISVVLPLTAGKQPDVHYGMDEEGELVVPYHDGKPTKNSLFSNIIERFLYSSQYGLFKGVTEDIIAQEVELLKKNFDKDEELGRTPDLSRFKELIGGSKEFSLKRIKESDYPKIKEIVNANRQLKMRLIASYRYPKIKAYKKEIENSAHVIPLMAKKKQGVTGMSGTLSNVPTLPKKFQIPQLSDTQSKTLEILRRRSPKTVATLSVDKTKRPENIYEKTKGEPGSIIDASGYFSEESNEEMARAMLKSLTAQKREPPIEGVVYYDGDVQKVVTVKDKNPVLYSKNMDREKLGALWDLSHITGSDIPVQKTMPSTMIISKHITLVALMQAAWRPRDLAKGQTLSFIITVEDKAYIIKMLKEYFDEDIDPNTDLSFDQFVRYALLNQAMIESGNNYRSVKERMKIALMSRVFGVMWADGTSFENAFKIYEQTRSLVIKELPNQPWDLWGAPTLQKPTEAALKELLASWKENSIIKAIQENPTLYPGLDVAELFAEWEGIVSGDLGPLPKKVSTAATYGSTVEKQMEQQTEQQMQQQTQTQVETHAKLELDPSKPNSRKHIPLEEVFEKRESNPMPLNDLIPLNVKELTNEFFQSKNASPSITVNDMVRSNKNLAAFTDMFDEDLLTTLNMAPVHKASQRQVDYEAFGQLQKACTMIELIVDEETHKIKVKLLDNADADEISRSIDGEKPDKSKVRIALYQLQNDRLEFEREGSKSVSLDHVETRGRLLELIVQAKFAAGFLEYRDEEIPYLKKWLEKVGPRKALDLMNHILNPVGRSDSRKRFSGSGISRIFEQLGLPKDLIVNLT